MRRFSGITVAALVIALSGMNLPAQICRPPAEMRAKLQGTPGADDYTNLGVWFAQRQQYDCAASAFGTSLQADPQQRDYPHVAFMFGSALFLSGDAKEAIPSLQEAERLGYRGEKIHVLLATALDLTGARADAEAEWRQALAFDPESTPALDALSNDLVADGDTGAVIAALDQPRLEGQRSTQQALNLGSAYVKAGEPERAAAVLQDALNTWPESTEIPKALVNVLNQLGRKDEAAAVLRVIPARQASPTN